MYILTQIFFKQLYVSKVCFVRSVQFQKISWANWQVVLSVYNLRQQPISGKLNQPIRKFVVKGQVLCMLDAGDIIERGDVEKKTHESGSGDNINFLDKSFWEILRINVQNYLSSEN